MTAPVTAILLSFVLLFSGPVTSTPGESRAVAVAAEVQRLGSRALWPGFDPSKVPLAIFDGENTYLFRHPHPPPEFRAAGDAAGIAIAPGRHPLLRANTSVSLGGTGTATLLLEGSERGARESALIAVHEAFHVFQAEHHPKWGGNEADLFTYPVDDPILLQLSRQETESLRRALAAKDRKVAACWSAAALDLRRRRFATLGESGARYERGTELKEGLARLVESRARGTAFPPEPVLPEQDFAAGEVRLRSYAVGHAFGVLLDRFAAGWDARLETTAGEETLDGLLAQAISTGRAGRPCRFSSRETAGFLDRAKRSVELALLTRAAIRDDFFARPGWRIVVVAAEPLSPQGFDPLNVETLGAGEVLHSRWVKLGNSAGSLEVLDARAVTESAGTHPLFEGVRRVTVTGVREEPEVTESAGAIALKATGVTAEFGRARLERKNRTITIVVSKAP